jgi:CRISPR-associated protein Csm2
MNTYTDKKQGGQPYSSDRSRNSYGYNEIKQIEVPDFNSPELLGKDAELLAKNVAVGTNLTTSQIRNFYGEIKSIERILATNDTKWPALYNRIKLVKAKAIYNKNRSKDNIKNLGPFTDFLSKSIDRITNDDVGLKNFKIFCQLFEAFVGYSSEYVRER